MQKMGYIYCGEDIGVFGIHRSGPAVDLRFNCMHIWTDCLAEFDQDLIEKAGYDPMDILFKGMAYRMIWFVHWNPKTNQIVTQPGGKRLFPNFIFFKLFNEVEKWMFNRTILDDEKGVVYQKDGTTVESINFDDFKEIVIPLPPLAEQQRIVAVIESAFAVIDEIKRSKTDLQSAVAVAKSKILSLAIRGKLVPQDPNDEPASALLERVRAEKDMETRVLTWERQRPHVNPQSKISNPKLLIDSVFF
jgi:hypothetical protein